MKMSELDLSTAEPEPDGFDIYDEKLDSAETLEEMEMKDYQYRRRENFWRNNGWSASLAPLAAGTVLMAVSVEKKLEINKREIAVISFVGTALSVLNSVDRQDKNRKKGQSQAVEAVPLSMELNGTIQPWIIRRLDEKRADEIISQAMRGRN
jgi:hypothetical protein